MYDDAVYRTHLPRRLCERVVRRTPAPRFLDVHQVERLPCEHREPLAARGDWQVRLIDSLHFIPGPTQCTPLAHR